MNTFFLFLISTLLLLMPLKTTSKLDNKQFLSNMLYFLGNLTKKYSSPENFSSCYDTINSQIQSDPSTVLSLLSNSGKSQSDLGLFLQCSSISNKDISYFLIHYKFNDINNASDDSDEKEVLNFLEQKDFFFGLCIFDQCTNLIYELGNNESVLNTLSISFLNIYPGRKNNLLNSSIVEYEKLQNEKEERSKRKWVFYIMMPIILGIFGIKLLVGIISFCYKKKDKEGEVAVADSEDDDSEGSEEEDLGENIKLNLRDSKSNDIFQTEKARKETEEDESPTKSFLFSIIDFFNIKNNISILYTSKNEYYNETNLHFIAMLKSIMIFLLIYNHNFYSLIKIPVKDFNNSSFYKSSALLLLKYSTFSINVLAALEGFSLAYKLLFYIKKNGDKNLTINLFLFYLRSLPQLLTYIIVFFLLNYSLTGIYNIKYLNLSPMFRYFVNDISQCHCNKIPALAFTPFLLQYYDFFDYNRNFVTCYKYTFYFSNLHFSLIITLLIIYISIKVKNHIIELIILVLYIINNFFFSFSCNSSKDEKLSIVFLFGEQCSTKYIHLFYTDYLTGVYCGIIYFYFVDIVSAKPLPSVINFTPFKFCFKIMKGIDSLSIINKNIIFISSLILQFGLSLIEILAIIFDDKLQIDISLLLKIVDNYEKRIFVIIFMLMVIVIQLEDSYSVKYLYESNLFTFISRNSFSMVSAMDTSIYLFYTSYYIQVYLNYHNMFFMACGLMFLVSFTSFVFTVVAELPFRMVLKKLMIQSERHKSESIFGISIDFLDVDEKNSEKSIEKEKTRKSDINKE